MAGLVSPYAFFEIFEVRSPALPELTLRFPILKRPLLKCTVTPPGYPPRKKKNPTRPEKKTVEGCQEPLAGVPSGPRAKKQEAKLTLTELSPTEFKPEEGAASIEDGVDCTEGRCD
jgi:hypothetical protein